MASVHGGDPDRRCRRGAARADHARPGHDLAAAADPSHSRHGQPAQVQGPVTRIPCSRTDAPCGRRWPGTVARGELLRRATSTRGKVGRGLGENRPGRGRSRPPRPRAGALRRLLLSVSWARRSRRRHGRRRRAGAPGRNMDTAVVVPYRSRCAGRTAGHLFNTITNGIRNMPAYGPQIPVEDRWAIVAYVRALQRSQNATSTTYPPRCGRDWIGEGSMQRHRVASDRKRHLDGVQAARDSGLRSCSP